MRGQRGRRRSWGVGARLRLRLRSLRLTGTQRLGDASSRQLSTQASGGVPQFHRKIF
jgi:hypothetical protein